jgi:hypothetical protein
MKIIFVLCLVILKSTSDTTNQYLQYIFFSYGATAPNGALAYLHETLRFTSVFLFLDRR